MVEEELLLTEQRSGNVSEADRALLRAYHHSFDDDDRVDLRLTLDLLHWIHSSQKEGQSTFSFYDASKH